ncbi:MAG: pantoate--beta-alanine ligase [Chloroflexi bacterium]|nr:pantoate--beta-alanine ligase [Chloroflexota bacterium]
MRIVTSVTAMQSLARRWKSQGVRVGLVPTMGYLHEGHSSLIRRARQSIGRQGQVVVSIYVNPTQFGPNEDLARYPRDLNRDKRLCRKAGVDVLLVPDDAQMYPAQKEATFSTFVVEQSLSHGIEGSARPTHFQGVTTVVAKLFNLVLPDIAVFGAKDFQQAAVVRRMARDLNFPVRLIVAPTRRDKDGLALSSRNAYLSSQERRQATILWRALQLARKTVRKCGVVPASRLTAQLRRLIAREPAARVDYIAFVDPVTLRPSSKVSAGTHLALAVFIGKTRLIDNARL